MLRGAVINEGDPKITDSQPFLRGYSSFVQQQLIKGIAGLKQECLRLSAPGYWQGWLDVDHMCQITHTRWKKAKQTRAELDPSADNLPKPNRVHWDIETQLHCLRDATFNEDRTTLRKGSSPQWMVSLRNTAMQLIKRANLAPASTLHLGSRFPKRIFKTCYGRTEKLWYLRIAVMRR